MRQLIGLSDADLLSRTEALCGDARQVLASVLVCIGEIEERKLHIEAACPRFVEFCAQRFRMSESEAFRRIVAARIVKNYPHVLERLERGEIHLTALYMLNDYLTPENHEQLIAEACGKSKRHLKELIAAWFPQPDVPNRMVPVVNEMTPTALPFAAPVEPTSMTSTSPTMRTSTSAPARGHIEPLSSTRYKFEFTGDSELRAKVEEATALLRHVNPSGEMAVVIGRALDVLIADLKKKKHAETDRPQKRRSRPSVADPSYIPAATRRAVYARDEKQCTFVSVDGRRCTSTEYVEIDHIVPLARGGTSDFTNLRLACRSHNEFFAEQAFGREHVAEQIELRRRNQRAAMTTRLAIDSSPQRDECVDMTESRLTDQHATSPASPATHQHDRSVRETLLSGLVNMGFRANDARRAVDTVLTRNPRGATPNLPSMICEALAILT